MLAVGTNIRTLLVVDTVAYYRGAEHDYPVDSVRDCSRGVRYCMRARRREAVCLSSKGRCRGAAEETVDEEEGGGACGGVATVYVTM